MTTHHVSLTEWEVRKPTQDSPLEGLVLAGNPKAQRRAETLTKGGQIEILELARGLELRASSYVGRFALGDLTVTIHPKITGAPLMNLLRYAYRLRQVDLFGEAGYATSGASFEDLLIHQLLAEVSELVARGLHRDYRRTNSMLTTPRGRIDFCGYLRAVRSASVALPCIHHPRSEDTQLNRALHGGLVLASRMTLDRELAGQCRRLAKTFAGEMAGGTLDASSLAEAWHSLDRRTRAYQPALTLIQLLLQRQGPTLKEDDTPIAASGFLFDMNRFFQALLSRLLAENLAGYEVKDEQTTRGIFRYDPDNNPLGRPSPSLRPDFVVERNRQVEAVLDAKYRDLWGKPLPREMLYQLALYALGRDGVERSATILYPTLEPAARQQVIFVRTPFRGTAEAQVVLRPVNLLRLDQLLRDRSPQAQRCRIEFAHQLAFGVPSEKRSACLP